MRLKPAPERLRGPRELLTKTAGDTVGETGPRQAEPASWAGPRGRAARGPRPRGPAPSHQPPSHQRSIGQVATGFGSAIGQVTDSLLKLLTFRKKPYYGPID